MPVARPALELRRLTPDWEEALAHFFQDLQERGEQRFFHPHPLTAAEARRIANYQGDDLYGVLSEGGRVLGYGMLRGWDEGYETPSLGLAVHPEARGQGLGRLLMSWLHQAARRRGARAVRLRVYPENLAALQLYRALGYRFSDGADGQLVGECLLA